MTIWKPTNRRSYTFTRDPDIRYMGHYKYKPPFVVHGRFASWPQGAEACIGATMLARVDAIVMDQWSDNGGSACAFRENDALDYETLLDDPSIPSGKHPNSPPKLHDAFFDYEIDPDAFIEYFKTRGAKLRIQYMAVIDSYHQSGGATGDDLIRQIVSGGFRDFGRGAYSAFRKNMKDFPDAVIVAEYVTIRFVGRLVP